MNPNNDSPDYLARAIDAKLRSMSIHQMAFNLPLLALMLTKGRVNKHPISRVDGGNNIVSIALDHDDVGEMTIDTIGAPLSQQTVSGVPNYIVAGKQKRARFNVFNYNIPIATPWFRKRNQNPAHYGNMVEEAMNSVKNKLNNIFAQELSGANADSETRIQGLRYILSDSNTVGGISQAENTWWKAQLKDHGAGAFLPVDLIADMNEARRIASYSSAGNQAVKIDTVIFGAPAGGLDLYSKIEDLLAKNLRYEPSQGVAKYGFDTMIFKGAELMQDFQSPVVDVAYLNGASLDAVGDVNPQMTEEQRIPGKPSREQVVYGSFQLCANHIRANRRRTNIGS